ncbi:MAG: hypothetical protein V4440_14545 [Pseudomonadota bacterium]
MVEGISHHFSDGLYAKEMFLPAGYTALSHSHVYSHLSILAKGKVMVVANSVESTYTAPVCINIAAHIHHEITALEDASWFCIHATNETDINKVDETLIERK